MDVQVAHGDVKSENVLITSDLTVLLTDFSSAFKPIYLPLDDPSDFSFFFDTSGRRTCYIAPERFYASDSKLAKERLAVTSQEDGWGKRNGKVTEQMDVFSAGCVLAEMWTDGRTVFNLSELYAYKEGSVGLGGILDNLQDEHVKVSGGHEYTTDEQNMISEMLSRAQEDRPSFDHILSSFRGTIFPEYFYTFFKDYAASLSELPETTEAAFLQRSAIQPGRKVDRLLNEWDSISVHLEGTTMGVDESKLKLMDKG